MRLFDIDQLVALGEVAAQPLLPSLRYYPAPGELAAGDTALPWTPAGSEGADAAVKVLRPGIEVGPHRAQVGDVILVSGTLPSANSGKSA